MKSSAIPLICLILLGFNSLATSEITEEESVAILTTSNFNDFLQQNKYALVEFVAPWCGHCKELTPKFQKAAVELKQSNPPVALGKVDATSEASLAEENKIEGYPTIFFYIDGVKQEYTGGRTTEDIVKWVQKKTNFQLVEISSSEDLQTLKKQGDNIFVFFGKKSSEGYTQIEDFARVEDIKKLSIVFTQSAELAATENAQQNTLVLYKNFEEGTHALSGPYTTQSIKGFYNDHAFPPVREFNYESAAGIFEDGKSALILMTHNNSESEVARQNFHAASKSLKGKIIMTESKFDGELGDRLAEFLGIDASSMPQFRILSFSEDNTKKYLLEGSYTEQDIIAFYQNWADGKLQPHFKSEPIPETNDGNVTIIVGLNYQDIVANSQKDVLLEFYAPWCGHCQQIAPKYERVGQLLKSNPNIVIAKSDATANEIEGVAVEGFPTIKFFPSTNKTNPIDYDGPRTVKGFVEFLQKHTTHPWVEVTLTEEEQTEVEPVHEDGGEENQFGEEGESSGHEDSEEQVDEEATEEKNPEL